MRHRFDRERWREETRKMEIRVREIKEATRRKCGSVPRTI